MDKPSSGQRKGSLALFSWWTKISLQALGWVGQPLLLAWRLFVTVFVLCPQPVRCDYHSFHKTNKTHTCWEFYLFLLQWYCFFFLTLSMAIKLKVYSGDQCFMGPKHPWMVLLRMPRIKRHGHSLNEQLSVIQKSKIAKPHILKE